MKKACAFKMSAALALAFFLFSISACKSLPDVSLVSADIEEVDYNGVQVLYKVQIENPASLNVPIPQVNWDLYIDKTFIATGTIDEKFLFVNDTGLVDIPVDISFIDIFTALPELKGETSTDYNIAFNLRFPSAVKGNKMWVVEHQDRLPLPLPPKLSSPVMKVDKVGPQGVELFVSVNVENPNIFDLPGPRLRFDYQLDGTSILRHRLNTRESLPSDSVSPVIFGILVYYHDVHRVLPYLQRARDVDSKLHLLIDFQVPAFAEDDFNVEMSGILPLNGRR